MKRIVLGVMAVVGVSVFVACGPGTPPQSQECKDYVACDKKTTKTASIDTTYSAMGTCWTTTTANADACTVGCKSGLAGLKAAYGDAGC